MVVVENVETIFPSYCCCIRCDSHTPLILYIALRLKIQECVFVLFD